MNSTDPWYVSDRSRAIVFRLLTKRKDLHLLPKSGDSSGEIDLLVEIRQGKKETLRLFGVQLNSCYSLPPDVEAGTVSSFTPSIPISGDYSKVYLPLCAFLIDVRKNDGGFFSWIVEPAIEEDEPKLIRHPYYHWEKIEGSTVDSIVSRVKEWYDMQHVAAK